MADGLYVGGKRGGFDSVAELIETQRLQIFLGGRDVLVAEYDLQASDINGLEHVGREGMAELVQVPICAARRGVALVRSLRRTPETIVQHVDGVLTFAVLAIQAGAKCNLLAQFQQMTVGTVALAVLWPRRVRLGREYQKRAAVSLAVPKSLNQRHGNGNTTFLVALGSEAAFGLGGDRKLAFFPVNVRPGKVGHLAFAEPGTEKDLED